MRWTKMPFRGKAPSWRHWPHGDLWVQNRSGAHLSHFLSLRGHGIMVFHYWFVRRDVSWSLDELWGHGVSSYTVPCHWLFLFISSCDGCSVPTPAKKTPHSNLGSVSRFTWPPDKTWSFKQLLSEDNMNAMLEGVTVTGRDGKVGNQSLMLWRMCLNVYLGKIYR